MVSRGLRARKHKAAAHDAENMIAMALKAKRAMRLPFLHTDERNHAVSYLVEVEKSLDDFKFLEESIRSNGFFDHLAPIQVKALVSVMKPMKLRPSVFEIQQGERGTNFYVVESGRLRFIDRGNLVGYANPGNSFGELALLFGSPRAVKVECETNSSVWILSRADYLAVVGMASLEVKKKAYEAFKISRVFSNLKKEEKALLLQDALFFSVAKGRRVMTREVNTGKCFFFIISGKVSVKTQFQGRSSKETLQSGDYFGLEALIERTSRVSDAHAVEDCDLMAIDKETVLNYLFPILPTLLSESDEKFLKGTVLFFDFPDEYLQRILPKIMRKTFEAEEVIFEAFKAPKEVFLLKKGFVDFIRVSKDGKVKSCVGSASERGTCFGVSEFLLAKESRIMKRRHRAVAREKTDVFVIDRRVFGDILGSLSDETKIQLLEGAISNSIDDNSSTASVVMNQPRLRRTVIRVNPSRLNLEDLDFRRVLGNGGYGSVRLVCDKSSKQYFALKKLDKRKLIDKNVVHHFDNERQILGELNHPLILELYKVIQDADYLYAITEFVHGGELSNCALYDGFKRRNLSKLQIEDRARFYTACLVDVLGYMHARNIMHRDLKPQNLLISRDGYLKVIDFGFARKLHLGERSNTMCGTMEYMAPELVLSQPYGLEVDNWSLGVVLYEMLLGSSPFVPAGKNRAESQLRIHACRSVVNARYYIPRGSISREAEEILRGFLTRNQGVRLGAGLRGFEKVKAYPWFKDIDFSWLRSGSLLAPVAPKLRHDGDASHYPLAFDDERDIRYLRPIADDPWKDKNSVALVVKSAV